MCYYYVVVSIGVVVYGMGHVMVVFLYIMLCIAF